MTVPAKSKLRLGLIAALGIVAALTALAVRAQWGLSQAEQFATAGDWDSVRQQLGWYLRLHPHDDRAHLLMARALASGNDPAPAAVRSAIEHLERVSDDSELAASAHVDAGRLELMVLRRPRHAETHFRHAVRLDGELFQAHLLLWKTLELTGRSRQAEAQFWKVYELSPAAARIMRLREWYVGQFHPNIASALMDRAFGFLQPDEQPSEESEKRRLDQFFAAEPDAPLAATSIAQWYDRRGNPRAALKQLDATAARLESAYDDPFFVATLVQVLLNLGDYERAQQAFDRWPAADRGHAYWLSRAVLLDEADAEYEQAVASYDKSLQIWPGPIDWRTQARKANCLARTGQTEQAQAARALSRKIQEALEDPLHQRVRETLSHMKRNSNLEEVVTFYRQFGRDREADCWEEQIAIYQASGPADYDVPVQGPGR